MRVRWLINSIDLLLLSFLFLLCFFFLEIFSLLFCHLFHHCIETTVWQICSTLILNVYWLLIFSPIHGIQKIDYHLIHLFHYIALRVNLRHLFCQEIFPPIWRKVYRHTMFLLYFLYEWFLIHLHPCCTSWYYVVWWHSWHIERTLKRFQVFRRWKTQCPFSHCLIRYPI